MTFDQLSTMQLDELKQRAYYDEEINCDPDIDDFGLECIARDNYGIYDFGDDDFGCTANRGYREVEVKFIFDEYQIGKLEGYCGRRLDDDEIQKTIEDILEELTRDCKEIV